MNCVGTVEVAHASFNVFPVTRNMPGAATMRISINIQEKNSARYFRVQSEHEQTLISKKKYSQIFEGMLTKKRRD